MSRVFSEAEVAKHSTEADCWIIVSGKVYNVTEFLKDHPGGKRVLLKVAGKDASKEFNQFHDAASVLSRYHERLFVGDLEGARQLQGNNEFVAPKLVMPGLFGSLIPFGDPNWYQGFNSPYYTDVHRRFRDAVRSFVDAEVVPNVDIWEDQKQIPKDFYRKVYEAGILPAVVGHPWQRDYVGEKVCGGVTPDEFDIFCNLILIDEFARAGSGGVLWGLFGGLSIGLPPIIHFGSRKLRDKCVGPCLRGEKFICLAITEPSAGSDVANIKTEAKLSADGKYYIVNGEKKWITNGVFSDFFTVAARTGGPGMGGVSLLLIERTMPGVTTRQMHCQGVWSSGTTYITFEDVKVPLENLIGEENKGFKYIMYNFNSERWGICVQGIRLARVCLEESIKYALKRKTFGKRLIDHPVIRMKLAQMTRQIEASHAWLENITYQMNTMSAKEARLKLGGPIASLKAQMSVTLEYCAREASQIFGGIAYTRSTPDAPSQGGKIERIYREVRAYAIPAGSEEIMLDLSIRQSLKLAGL